LSWSLLDLVVYRLGLLQSADAEGRLGAVSHLKLREHVRDVVLHGLDADAECARDFGVVASFGDQGEYFALSFGQVGAVAWRVAAPQHPCGGARTDTSTACSPRTKTRTCPVARSATRTRGRATTLRALTGPGWRRYHRGASPAARRVSAVERAAQTAGPKVYLFGKMAGPNIHVPRSARAERACSGAAPRGASAWNRAAHERRLSSALIAPSGDQHRR
jgi:hypothetical protein